MAKAPAAACCGAPFASEPNGENRSADQRADNREQPQKIYHHAIVLLSQHRMHAIARPIDNHPGYAPRVRPVAIKKHIDVLPSRFRPLLGEPSKPRQRPDWYDAEYMTLCIGALCQLPVPISPRIVLAFDYKVSTDWFASESEHKLHVLSHQFVALFSGRPGRAKELAVIYKSHFSRAILTEENLLDNLREPLQIMRRKLANAYVQRCLGLSYAEFLSNGQDWSGAETVEKYRNNIESNALGVDMIFAGFIGKEPILCELRDGEIDQSTNFSLIGSGAYSAEPALPARQQTRNRALSQTMYNVHEAKRIGETSPGVGKDTSMLVLSPPENGSEEIGVHIVTDSGGQFLEKLYKRYGPKLMKTWPNLPPGTLQRALLKMPQTSTEEAQ